MNDLTKIIVTNLNGGLPVPKDFPSNRFVEYWKNILGLSFLAPEASELVDRSQVQNLELEQYLDSAEHTGDRIRLLPYIQGPNVLELASGSGSVLQLIAQQVQNLDRLVGMEFSSYFFQHAAERLFAEGAAAQNSEAQVFLVRGDVTKARITPSFFNSVVLASIVHEIKSLYGTDAVEAILVNAYCGLEKGGSLLLYDGFRRTNEMARLILHTSNSRERFQDYIDGVGREIPVSYDQRTPILPLSDAMEFATKLQAREGWNVELREEYYPFSLQQYRSMLEQRGFSVVTHTFPEEINPLVLRRELTVLNNLTGKDELLSHNNVLCVARK